jgi:hypothetical protein
MPLNARREARLASGNCQQNNPRQVEEGHDQRINGLTNYRPRLGLRAQKA